MKQQEGDQTAMIKLQCEVCTHEVAKLDPSKASLPIRGAMFTGPEENMPCPFPDDVDWQWMKCPMCGRRPFLQEGQFTTADGAWMHILDGKVFFPKEDRGLVSVDMIGPWVPPADAEVPKEGIKVPTTDTRTTTVDDEIIRLVKDGLRAGEITKKLKKVGVNVSPMLVGKRIKVLEADGRFAT